MAHLIDNSKGFNAFIANGAPAWHGLGTITNGAFSAAEALEKGGLNFEVYKAPNIHILHDGQQIISPDSFFTYRTDVMKVLGSKLGKDYEVLQNIEALNIVDEILQQGNATIETAGAIDGGKKIFICLKIGADIIVNGNDTVKQYMLITTSHDGSLSITALPTNIRVVCNNTLTAALRDKANAVKIRHTKNAAARLAEAMKVFKLIDENTGFNTDNYNKMQNTVISKAQLMDYFGNVYFDAAEIKALQDGNKFDVVIKTQKQNTIAQIMNFADHGTGQALAMQGNSHTMWSAYNAVTGYISRQKFTDADSRANSMLFGTSAERIRNAGLLAIAPEKIKPLHKKQLGNINLN